MKLRFSTNSLLFLFNVTIFVIQCAVFMVWSGQLKDDTKSHPAQVHLEVNKYDNDDDVMVYNGGLNKIEDPHNEEPEKAPIGEPLAKPEDVESTNTWNWNWDGRANTKPVANRFLYFVRHGQYYGNGPYEKHLSPLGQQQAMKTGEKLKSHNITFNRFRSSTSIRAAETAEFIHKVIDYLDVEYSDDLREGWPAFPDPPSPGTWEKENPIFANDVPRIQGAFEKYIHRADPDMRQDSNELIVVNGNVISYTVLRALQVPVTRWLKIAILQGSITLLHIQPDGDVALRFLGDVGHLTKKDWSG